jgi:hypothetical protein
MALVQTGNGVTRDLEIRMLCGRLMRCNTCTCMQLSVALVSQARRRRWRVAALLLAAYVALYGGILDWLPLQRRSMVDSDLDVVSERCMGRRPVRTAGLCCSDLLKRTKTDVQYSRSGMRSSGSANLCRWQQRGPSGPVQPCVKGLRCRVAATHLLFPITPGSACPGAGVAVKPTCINRAALAAVRRYLRPRTIHVVTATQQQCDVFESWAPNIRCHLQVAVFQC